MAGSMEGRGRAETEAGTREGAAVPHRQRPAA